MLYAVLKPLVWLLFRACYRLRVRGARNVPPSGAVVLASNHQSFLDPLIIGVGCGRPVWFMARDTLFRNGVFAWVIRRLHAFPVRRGGADRDALREALSLLAGGQAVLVFPEGSRTADGRIGSVRRGPVLLAQRAAAPIVPVVISGAFQVWPRQRSLPKLWGRMRLRFGEQILPPIGGGRDAYERVRAEIQRKLEEMMNDE